MGKSINVLQLYGYVFFLSDTLNPSYLRVGYNTPTKHLTPNYTSLVSLTPVSAQLFFNLVPQICKTFNIHHRKKSLIENFVKFYFSMGTVHVIFSFFRMDNDLVCVPPLLIVVFPHHNYAHTLVHISKLLTRFS